VIRKLLNALALYLILIFAFLGVKEGTYLKLFVFYAYCATSVGLALFNIGFVIFLKYYRRVGYNYRRVVIAGYGKIATDLRKYFTYNPELGYRFLGYFDDTSSNALVLGRVGEIPAKSKELEID
jgi:putative colanic acid biosynthesis UDP-glucose lipid carrier transferase